MPRPNTGPVGRGVGVESTGAVQIEHAFAAGGFVHRAAISCAECPTVPLLCFGVLGTAGLFDVV